MQNCPLRQSGLALHRVALLHLPSLLIVTQARLA